MYFSNDDEFVVLFSFVCKVTIFIRPLEGSIYIFITTLDIIGERMSMLLIIMHTQ